MSRLNPFKQPLRLDWKYALTEIALIFVGITLAIAFNNWNERRKLKTIERKILAEIRDEILIDMKDVSVNERTYYERAADDSVCLIVLRGAMPCDSVRWGTLWRPYAATSVLFHMSAYESLKARGVDLIDNVELRHRIVQLYGFEYEIMTLAENAEFYQPMENGLTRHLISRHLRPLLSEGSDFDLALKDCDDFRQDEELVKQQMYHYFANSGLAQRYSLLKKQMLATTEAIQQELAK